MNIFSYTNTYTFQRRNKPRLSVHFHKDNIIAFEYFFFQHLAECFFLFVDTKLLLLHAHLLASIGFIAQHFFLIDYCFRCVSVFQHFATSWKGISSFLFFFNHFHLTQPMKSLKVLYRTKKHNNYNNNSFMYIILLAVCCFSLISNQRKQNTYENWMKKKRKTFFFHPA